ncbi:hypothetical protein HY311_03065 [Candidatus Nomurabacteria bacterium]|nr:hypothetical protein [Candidatus Nomurabacteria bacterium]
MDEQNLEIKKLSSVSKKVVVYILVILLLAVGVCVLIIQKKPAKQTVPDNGMVNTTKPVVVSNIVDKNPAGIVLPTPGFPVDLMLEPKVVPTTNKTEYSLDGNNQTATREYESSQYDIYTAHYVFKDYLTRKGWGIMEVITPNAKTKPQDQTELKFLATKGNYKAVLDFKKADDQNAIINIVVESPSQIK